MANVKAQAKIVFKSTFLNNFLFFAGLTHMFLFIIDPITAKDIASAPVSKLRLPDDIRRDNEATTGVDEIIPAKKEAGMINEEKYIDIKSPIIVNPKKTTANSIADINE